MAEITRDKIQRYNWINSCVNTGSREKVEPCSPFAKALAITTCVRRKKRHRKLNNVKSTYDLTRLKVFFFRAFLNFMTLMYVIKNATVQIQLYCACVCGLRRRVNKP